MQPEPMAYGAFRSTVLEIKHFGHPSDDRPMLLNFRDRNPTALTAKPSRFSFFNFSFYNVSCGVRDKIKE
jgi:hypothetical protein